MLEQQLSASLFTVKLITKQAPLEEATICLVGEGTKASVKGVTTVTENVRTLGILCIPNSFSGYTIPYISIQSWITKTMNLNKHEVSYQCW